MKFEKQLAREIKYKALFWLRIKQRCAFIATEVGAWNADAFGVSEKKTIEIEIKVTKTDLYNDAKKWKHRHFKEQGTQFASSFERRWIPTQFYYAVPSELIDDCKEYLAKHNFEKYGIINADDFTVVKRAKKIHEREPDSHCKFIMALRMGSELVKFHEAWV